MKSDHGILPYYCLFNYILFLSSFESVICDIETTTHNPPVNKGAARQMYGSGSLRQSANEPLLTSTGSSFDEKNGEQDFGNEEESIDELNRMPFEPSYDGRNYDYGVINHRGYERTHKKLPAEFDNRENVLPGSLLDEDVPSYRNGAPVNGIRNPITNHGGLYGQAGVNLRLLDYIMGRKNGRGRLHGGFNGAYGGDGIFTPDRSRVLNGLERGHGVSQTGNANDRFGPDQKTLIQELEDEGDKKDGIPLLCGWMCARDQFPCLNSCNCISLDARCDGVVDCENSEDEVNCEDIYESKNSNGTCFGERNVPCPETDHCIYKHWLCDGDDDCGDYSDESHCGNASNCTEDQFECKNGLCVPSAWHCDGEDDCKDFSDETNCNVKKNCNEQEYKCPDGICISKNFRCDGEPDCTDGSDESKCEISEIHCRENEFECSYPRCILLAYRCDGDDDCGDWSDEENCPATTGSSCNANEFRCASGKCISDKWVCDKEVDCNGGEDEEGCKHRPPRDCSPHNEFTCSPGTCIPRQWTCDGVPDCPNSEDEQGCAITCEMNQYLCQIPSTNHTNSPKSGISHPIAHHYHHCILKKHICDGIANCPLQDDEMNCPKRTNCTSKDKCTQHCILTADNRKSCSCDPGFILGSDKVTCNDMNECEFEKDPVCSQLCNNTIGSFVCACMTGYVLRPDLRTCKAVGANPTLLLANRVDIKQINFGDFKSTSILKDLHNAIALDYHYKAGTIYWSDVSLDRIRKLHVNGTQPEDVIRWGLETPSGVAIDWIHDLLFWTDAGTRRVEVITLDARVRHVLISSDLDKPRAIAVHPNFGFVYWTDWGPNPKIERADMDGSGRLALITDSIFWPNGLTIDYTSDRIFWTDAKHHVIESAHLDGTDRKKIISKGLHHPFAITVFEDTLYWTDWHFKIIASANKVNGRGYKIIQSGFHFPMDIHSYHPQRQPQYANHCSKNNGDCSHMCLPNSTGYSCVCPVGLKLKKDNKNCVTTADNLLIFARKKDLRLMPIDQSTRVFDTVIPVDHIQSAVALTWDAHNETIFWTDIEANTISKAFLNGTNQSIVVGNNLESPAGLAMDWITNKLYWTDAGANRIECSNLDGSMRSLLVYIGLDKPRDIVVDPIVGYMYWSDWGANPKIERSSMDGNQRKILINTNLTWPNGLAIDFEERRLYWADGGTKRIEYSDLDGKGRTTLIGSLPHPFGLVVHKNKIYWTDWDTSSIYRADKMTGTNINVIRYEISGLMDVRIFHRNRKNIDSPCHHSNMHCSHLCLIAHNPQRYKCACPTGLVLKSDGRTCSSTPSKFLLIAHRVNIRVVSLDVNYLVDVVLPISNMKNTSGVDVNRKTGDVYWTDPELDVIRRASFDGRIVETIIDTGLDTADSLVVDSIGEKIYWTDAGLNSIEVSELNGRNRKVLIWSGLDNPRAIAIHYETGLLFWSDWGHNARIERANMDGGERMIVIADNLVWPNGLTIDQEEYILYWNDAKRKVIEYSDFLGQNRKVLTKAEHPYGLAVLGNYVYWTDWMSKAVMRFDKTKKTDGTVILDKLPGLMDIRAVTVWDKSEMDNVCVQHNGGCSHLCLRNPKGYSCACPTGLTLKDDKKTCQQVPTNFLLFATRKSLARISFDTPEMWEVTLSVPDIRHALSVDFHWEKGLIFYTDANLTVIRSVNMYNHSDIKTIIHGSEMSSPFSIGIDWLANNIYWTDYENRKIEVAKIDGTSRKKLITDLVEPRSLVLFPKQGYLFWTDLGQHPKIQRSTLDGKSIKTIVSTDLAFPNGLTIDYVNNKIFWGDALKNRIEMSDLHGQYRIPLVPNAINAFGLTLHSGRLYWGDWLYQSIEQVDKDTGTHQIKIRTTRGAITDLKAVSATRQTGWTPCAMENGGCTHLCFFVRKNYTCACPDDINHTHSCSTVPKKNVPLRKPGTENNPDYNLDDDEPKLPEVVTRSNHGSHEDDKFKDYKFNREKGYSLKTVVITIVIMVIITLVIVGVIIYLLCQRKTRQKKFIYTGRRNLTFSNPNYNASAGGDVAPSNPTQDKKSLIWKRLKYSKSQERVYEDNGQTSSPEVLSLIPPSATPSSSRAASVTPRESSPPMTHLNG